MKGFHGVRRRGRRASIRFWKRTAAHAGLHSEAAASGAADGVVAFVGDF